MRWALVFGSMRRAVTPGSRRPEDPRTTGVPIGQGAMAAVA